MGLLDLKIGDQVFWKDPQEGLSSGRYAVVGIHGEPTDGDTIVLVNNGVTEAEVPLRELVLLEPGTLTNEQVALRDELRRSGDRIARAIGFTLSASEVTQYPALFGRVTNEVATTLLNLRAVMPVSVKGQAFIDAATKKYAEEGSVEIDADALVSESENGAYVQAWVWVARDTAHLCANEVCENSIEDGEGYDGYCGPCADRMESDE
jgi:hypothetical protein